MNFSTFRDGAKARMAKMGPAISTLTLSQTQRDFYDFVKANIDEVTPDEPATTPTMTPEEIALMAVLRKHRLGALEAGGRHLRVVTLVTERVPRVSAEQPPEGTATADEATVSGGVTITAMPPEDVPAEIKNVIALEMAESSGIPPELATLIAWGKITPAQARAAIIAGNKSPASENPPSILPGSASYSNE
jgi:hypothetical protein